MVLLSKRILGLATSIAFTKIMYKLTYKKNSSYKDNMVHEQWPKVHYHE